MTLVVPCFDEARRLRMDELARLLDESDLALVLVDDGSTDDTPHLLDQFAAIHPTATVVHLEANAGKGEAVRRGLLRAIESGPEWVGYFDADLATPIDEIVRLVRIALRQPAEVRAVIASRVRLLGSDINRSAIRHYLGRVFATAASMVLELPVYDTQCGAKLFRADDLREPLAEPFTTRWIFDVELLQRLCARLDQPARAIIEVPLQQWSDVHDSKLGPTAMLRAGWQLLRLRLRSRP